jgi:transcriptional regulator with XRE-family HTH domain
MATTTGTAVGHQRGIQVQGEYLRYLRKLRGWTQQDLAERAGYCDRLIRKAERDGFLMPETIEVLAQTLSTPEAHIEPNLLWLLPKTKIWLLLRLLRGEVQVTESAISAVATESVMVTCKGPECIPFAGDFLGLPGMRCWLQLFRSSIAKDQPHLDEHEVMVEQQHAFLHSCWIFEKDMRRSKSIDLDIRIDILMGQIQKMVVISDTLDFIEFFEQHKLRGNRNRLPRQAR